MEIPLSESVFELLLDQWSNNIAGEITNGIKEQDHPEATSELFDILKQIESRQNISSTCTIQEG